MRLDRWFRTMAPELTQGALQKLLRTGQVRVNGKRAKASHRLAEGEVVRVPPLPTPSSSGNATSRKPHKIRDEDAHLLPSRVIHMDDHVIVIDKPAGLAVQGGAGTTRHVDGLLESLQFGLPERPRLVHRLDKDTSGLLVVARDRKTATALASAFRTRDVKKLYWAITAGVPERSEGRIDAALLKSAAGKGGHEKMVVDQDRGDRAITDFRVIDHAGQAAAWVALQPQTGRTHQLRAHLAAINTPILGDGKYGGTAAHPSISGIGKGMYLHAKRLLFRLPGGALIDTEAPVPGHLADALRILGLDDLNADAGMFLDQGYP
ncbi:MAG: RluA family pseudouridine synthase [Rhodospirillales bacterium]